MSEIYTERLTLRSRDVDMFRRLRTSELFKLLQEASIRHTEQLGMGRDRTLDRGVLWVLLMQRAEIARMPEYDERIVLRSWPGKTMHLLFPRFYSLETEAGEELVKARPSGAWWMKNPERQYFRSATASRSQERKPERRSTCLDRSGSWPVTGRSALRYPTVLLT